MRRQTSARWFGAAGSWACPSSSPTFYPWNNGWPRAEALIRELNALIAALGVPVLPFHETLEDPERPGRMREEWTSDGDHPSVEGYRRLGELAFRLP